ncbi:uncharacterized protein LOC134533421 [Bacillus rossius redtenbacheri]|uniref:uncharacterized protein LOC134533421 n=1 Tax=Bacillus rossius redtenbacheri TaxID=93214 RepID=UPI002FDE947E
MNALRRVWWQVALLSASGEARLTRQLGGECRMDRDCSSRIKHSRCHEGRCGCEPYYAPYNNSKCLESTLLGFDCLVPEQCSLKVAHSSCSRGVCRCESGYLQFRRHTCLSPASPGDVCYSDTHCRLWDGDTHCHFLIPKLFGRCQCNAALRQEGKACVPDSGPYDPQRLPSSPAAAPSTGGTTPELFQPHHPSTAASALHVVPGPTGPLVPDTTPGAPAPSSPSPRPEDSEEPVVIQLPGMADPVPAWLTTQSPWTTVAAEEDAPSSEQLDPETTTLPPDRMVQSDPMEFQPTWNVEVTTDADETTTTTTTTTTSLEFESTSGTNLASGEELVATTAETEQSYVQSTPTMDLTGAVSLGLACSSDGQCAAADPHSRCLRGVCDCAASGGGGGGEANLTSCGARSRGCHPGTFQCRSSGRCVSWFFVCDGRRDCADGSDEECRGGQDCPPEAFRCDGAARDRVCVSRAALCDGAPDCPRGEDERGCGADQPGCPPDTFRCADGACLPEYEFCNAVVSCRDGSDEPRAACRSPLGARAAGYCPFRCANGRCRSGAIACSGRDGCGDGSDEAACSVCKCPALP